MIKAQIAVVGLGVMGQNLALNMASKGYTVAVYNRTSSTTKEFIQQQGSQTNLIGVYTYEEMASTLEEPRKILLMVKAGSVVDAVIQDLQPLLDSGDILIDGGNSFFEDTERRFESLAQEGIYFVGAGVSGGEEGARLGPSIMPGGSQPAWDAISEIFNAIAAKAKDGEPCVDYMGERGAGHYVKMVHNGIEYAIMQMIAEVYDLLHRALGLTDSELGEIFTRWNEGPLASYLIEITRDILKTEDPETGQPILDVILDEAKQKGTGKWTSQNALDLGVPTHVINAAVTSRIVSGMKDERTEASKVILGPKPVFNGDVNQMVDAAEAALFAGVVLSYVQGFGLMQQASQAYNYNLDLEKIAKIWRAGCIIRAELLEDIRQAYQKNEDLNNLLLDDYFVEVVTHRQGALRYVITSAVGMGIPVYALSAALSYFDAFRTERLPANLTQAQRDYFGAHTYRRLDKKGTFHTEWQEK